MFHWLRRLRPYAARRDLTDVDLKYGPCVVCSRAEDSAEWVSRMQCEKCGLYSLKGDVHHFQGCSNDPNTPKTKRKVAAKA